jgi:hypothetical protein
MKKTALTQGKKNGNKSFTISEILLVPMLAVLFIMVSKDIEPMIIANMFSGILIYQSAVHTVVWGGVATKNFKRPDLPEKDVVQ